MRFNLYSFVFKYSTCRLSSTISVYPTFKWLGRTRAGGESGCCSVGSRSVEASDASATGLKPSLAGLYRSQRAQKRFLASELRRKDGH